MVLLHAPSTLTAPDPLEQMALDDREDWVLLRIVVCVAVATVLLAAASTMLV
jgi:hypothetical protein